MTTLPWQRKADAYWARELGCGYDDFFTQPLLLKAHGQSLNDYNGIFALFKGERAIVSFPPGSIEQLASSLPQVTLSPELLASHFEETGHRVIGPAFIGYASAIPEDGGEARTLDTADRAAVEALRASCSEMEWDHGGSELVEQPCSGSFERGDLAALAGFEIWDDAIAHICVVANPRFRGRGHARRAVAHVASKAIAEGLLPQYRTLESNLPSMKIAASLGFERYASSVAVRL
jgi:GNAT superfamily N-acetyltransferase